MLMRNLHQLRHLLVDMAENTVFSMREKMQRKLEVLPLNYIDTHKRGDILARATGDMVTLTNVLETNLPAVFTNLLTIIGTVAMMMVTNIRLSLIFFVMMPLSILSMRLISANAKKLFKKQQEAEGELNAHIEECLTGNEAMRAFNYEEEAYRQLETINVKFFRTYVRSRALSGLFSPIMTLLNNLVYIALCVFGAQAILKGTLTVGGLGAFLIYANNISGPINHFSAMLNQVQAGLAAAERVFEVLDEEPETPDNPETSVQMDETKGIVDFEHVKFGYTPKNILMHDVSFHVDSGQIFAIVGPSGAGKTTLVNLPMRFYEINGGTISLDGNPISELTCGGLRKVKGTKSEKIKAYKKEIDKLIFPEPRCIPIRFAGEMNECQRPLRAQTAQGERVSLAISEQVPAGAVIEFSVVCLCDDHEAAVREWLDYGKYSGIGQWRNSGKGRFTWEEIQ